MKIVKLSKEYLTQWRQNISHLVDDDGVLQSQVDKPLEAAIAQVTRSARSQRKTLVQKVAIGKDRTHTIEVTVTRTGNNVEDLSLSTSVDGHRVVTGRQVVAAIMLGLHGECQLRAPNNVILKVVRNPEEHRPTYAESQKMAPSPAHCPCKTWGHPHPGKHYPTCEYNRLAPPEERAVTDAVPEDEVRLLPTEAFASLRPRTPKTAANAPIAARVSPNAVIAQAASIDSPDNCRNVCLGWATPKGFPIPPGQHHPTCDFAKPWAIQTARDTPRWLIDMRTGEKVRVATDAEVGQAEVTAQRTGSPIIHIDETPYAVVMETALEELQSELSAAPTIAVIAPSGSLTTDSGAAAE